MVMNHLTESHSVRQCKFDGEYDGDGDGDSMCKRTFSHYNLTHVVKQDSGPYCTVEGIHRKSEPVTWIVHPLPK